MSPSYSTMTISIFKAGGLPTFSRYAKNSASTSWFDCNCLALFFWARKKVIPNSYFFRKINMGKRDFSQDSIIPFGLGNLFYSILRHSFFDYLFSMSGKAHSVEGSQVNSLLSSRMSLPHDCCPMLYFYYISLRNPRAYSINRESKGDSLRNTKNLLFFHWCIL